MFSSSARSSARLAAMHLRRPACGAASRYSSYQPPNHRPAKPESGASSNAHRAFYGDFGLPVLKVFFGALATYQVLYWGWLKLESIELKDEKNGEMARLEQQVRELAGSNKGSK